MLPINPLLDKQTHITHYWAIQIEHSDRWCILQKAADSAGNHYSIAGCTHGLRIVSRDEAVSIQRTGKLPPDANPPREGS